MLKGKKNQHLTDPECSFVIDSKNPQLGGYPADLDPVKVDEPSFFAPVIWLKAVSNYQRSSAGS